MKHLPLLIAVLLLVLVSIYTLKLRNELKHYEDAASIAAQSELSDPCEVKLERLEHQLKAAMVIAEENHQRAIENAAEAVQNQLRAKENQRLAMNAQKEAQRMMQIAQQNEKMLHEKVQTLEEQLKQKD